jgi:hypothetical protein
MKIFSIFFFNFCNNKAMTDSMGQNLIVRNNNQVHATLSRCFGKQNNQKKSLAG